MHIFGIGSVQIQMYDGVSRTFTNVRFVLFRRKFMIFLGQLTSLGCNITIERETLRILRIFKETHVIMKGIMVRNLYLLKDITILESRVLELIVLET